MTLVIRVPYIGLHSWNVKNHTPEIKTINFREINRYYFADYKLYYINCFKQIMKL
jgi:hypothetical protein